MHVALAKIGNHATEPDDRQRIGDDQPRRIARRLIPLIGMEGQGEASFVGLVAKRAQPVQLPQEPVALGRLEDQHALIPGRPDMNRLTPRGEAVIEACGNLAGRHLRRGHIAAPTSSASANPPASAAGS